MITTFTRFFTLSLALLTAAGSMTGQRAITPSSNLIASFSQENQSTLTTLQNLATETHTVMGVSGKWIGADDKLITVNKQNAPLSEILDDICRADPRFSWDQAGDGSIQIHLGKEHLSLSDVIVGSLDGKTIAPDKLVSEVLMMPEVRSWSEHNSCNVLKVMVDGGKKTFETPISELGSGQPLWKVLDQIEEKTNLYFWYMIKFSNKPCAINLNP